MPAKLVAPPGVKPKMVTQQPEVKQVQEQFNILELDTA
jgi:hypothetical protein